MSADIRTFDTDARDVGRAFGGALIFGIPALAPGYWARRSQRDD